MIRVTFLPAAEEELLDAVAVYSGESVDLAADFLRDVEHALDRISLFPEHGSPHLAGARRVVVHRFFTDLVYELHQEEALIVAVAPHRRAPGYWRSRLHRRA